MFEDLLKAFLDNEFLAGGVFLFIGIMHYIAACLHWDWFTKHFAKSWVFRDTPAQSSVGEGMCLFVGTIINAIGALFIYLGFKG